MKIFGFIIVFYCLFLKSVINSFMHNIPNKNIWYENFLNYYTKFNIFFNDKILGLIIPYVILLCILLSFMKWYFAIPLTIVLHLVCYGVVYLLLSAILYKDIKMNVFKVIIPYPKIFRLIAIVGFCLFIYLRFFL